MDSNTPYKKPRANPVYITPVVRQTYNSESSDDLPEGDSEYRPTGKRKKTRKKRAPTNDKDEDDEIAIVKEKINPKTKAKLMQKKTKSAKNGAAVQEMLKRLAEFSQSANTIKPGTEEAEDDDSDLTCSKCLISFWYSRELNEHNCQVHGF